MNFPARDAAMANNLSDPMLNLHAFIEVFTTSWQGQIILGFFILVLFSIFALAKLEEKNVR